VGRPTDLETYDGVYVATRVDACVSRTSGARASSGGAGISGGVVRAVPGRRLRAARGDAAV